MKNYVQAGKSLTLPAPAAILSGDVVVIGEIRGIAAGNAATGEDCDVVTEGVFELPKVAADEFAIGDPAYWDGTAKRVTSTASGNTKIGVAVAAAAVASGVVNVKLT